VAAPRPGRVTAILVSEGQFVNEGDPLVEFE
jgi:biotin carboxyl carrier protein